jgi:YD repeat-containing protein
LNVGRQLEREQAGTGSYTYDALNRLKTYTRPGAGSQTYSYDRFGNRAVRDGASSPVTALTPLVADEQPSSVEVLFPNNRWTALTYDAAGNVLNDPAGTGRSYTYDAENRVKTATMPNTPAITYSYDAEGRRVRKEVAGQATTVFVYDAFGQLAAEYGPRGRDRSAVLDGGSLGIDADGDGSERDGGEADGLPAVWGRVSGGGVPELGVRCQFHVFRGSWPIGKHESPEP